MAEKLTSTAKKSKPKKIDGKTKEELQWEIRVCQAAMEIRQQEEAKVKRSDLLGNIFRFVILGVPGALFLVYLKMNLLLAILIPVGLVLLLNACLIREIHKEREITSYGCADCLEVLSERLRIARLCLDALANDTTLSESDKRYRLSFGDADKRICGNCAYMGKLVKETKITYSDGSTDTSSKLDHYFCDKMNEMRVKTTNTCDKFASKRVLKAFSAAGKIYDKAADILREEDRKSVNGFR